MRYRALLAGDFELALKRAGLTVDRGRLPRQERLIKVVATVLQKESRGVAVRKVHELPEEELMDYGTSLEVGFSLLRGYA